MIQYMLGVSKTGFSKTGFMDVGFSTIHFHVCSFTFIHVHSCLSLFMVRSFSKNPSSCRCAAPGRRGAPWLRTNGVQTDGAAAKVIMIFDRLWEKVRPGTFGEIKVG